MFLVPHIFLQPILQEGKSNIEIFQKKLISQRKDGGDPNLTSNSETFSIQVQELRKKKLMLFCGRLFCSNFKVSSKYFLQICKFASPTGHYELFIAFLGLRLFILKFFYFPKYIHLVKNSSSFKIYVSPAQIHYISRRVLFYAL